MRISFFATMAAVVILAACNQPREGNTSDASQRNLVAARSVVRAFQTGDMSGVDSVVAADFVDHTDRGDVKGRDSLKAMITQVRTNFKDMKMETVAEATDGNYVFQWMKYTGTSDGTMGMPAGPYEMRAIEVSEFNDGKITEHWAYMDVQEMMKMMGSNRSQGAQPKADSAIAQ
jgi:steroid delta-isomerase-like uncharacterized protein